MAKQSNYISTQEQRLQAADDARHAAADGFYINGKGKKVAFPDRGYAAVEYVTDVTDADPKIVHVPKYSIAGLDSFEALTLTDISERTAVLNFACATTPGGGFLTGSKAQEECLCRQSTLYESLISKDAAPYYRNNIACKDKLRPETFLYSPDVWVFRNPDLTYRDTPVRTQVVTMAAPNLKGAAKGVAYADLASYFMKSIRMMCQYLTGRADTLILGAWGCGAFGNEPGMVAECMRKVLVDEGLDRRFAHIIFAVRNARTENYREFQRVFSTQLGLPAPKKTAKKKSTDTLPLGIEKPKGPFERGNRAYVVLPKDKPDGEWITGVTKITSSGRKWVTITRGGKSTKFPMSSKPILLNEKKHMYLVSEATQAERLARMLTDTARIEKREGK